MTKDQRKGLILDAVAAGSYPITVFGAGSSVELKDEQAAFAFVENAPDIIEYTLTEDHIPGELTDENATRIGAAIDIPSADEVDYAETSDPDELASAEVASFFSVENVATAFQISAAEAGGTVIMREVGWHQLNGRFPIGAYVNIAGVPHQVVNDTVRLCWLRNIKNVQNVQPNVLTDSVVSVLIDDMYPGKGRVLATLTDCELWELCNRLRTAVGAPLACCHKDDDMDGNCPDHPPKTSDITQIMQKKARLIQQIRENVAALAWAPRKFRTLAQHICEGPEYPKVQSIDATLAVLVNASLTQLDALHEALKHEQLVGTAKATHKTLKKVAASTRKFAKTHKAAAKATKTFGKALTKTAKKTTKKTPVTKPTASSRTKKQVKHKTLKGGKKR